ncbi:hypothetical protein Tco_1095950 [Tanacetum coccineum]
MNKSKLVSKYAFLWPCCLLLSTDLHNVLSFHRHYKLWILIVASFTQRTISSIPIGGSISPEGFLLPVLFVAVIYVVVVIVIVGVVIVVVFGIVVVVGVSSIFKLSFMVVDSFSCYWSSACPGVLVNIVSICH